MRNGYSGSRTQSLARMREYVGRGHPMPETAPDLHWFTVWTFVDRIPGKEYGVVDETPDSVPSGAR